MKSILFVFGLVLLLVSCGNEEKEKKESREEKPSEVRRLMRDSTNLNKDRLDELNDLIVEDPDNANHYHERAYYYFHKQKLESALQDVKKAIELDPKSSAYYFSKGYFFHAMLRLEEAKTAFSQAIELDPQNEDAHLFLAKIYMALAKPGDRDNRNYEKAMEHLVEAIEINEFNAEAYFWRGVIYEELGDTGIAVSNYKTAIETDPEHYNAFMRLGILYSHDGNPKAETSLLSALDIKPKSAEALFALGKLYQDTKQFDKADSTYHLVIAQDSLYSIAYLNLGYMYMTYDTLYDKALRYLHKAVYFNPGGFLPMTYHNIGIAYELQGKYDRAKQYYKEALKADENYTAAARSLDALVRKGY